MFNHTFFKSLTCVKCRHNVFQLIPARSRNVCHARPRQERGPAYVDPLRQQWVHQHNHDSDRRGEDRGRGIRLRLVLDVRAVRG